MVTFPKLTQTLGALLSEEAHPKLLHSMLGRSPFIHKMEILGSLHLEEAHLNLGRNISQMAQIRVI